MNIGVLQGVTTFDRLELVISSITLAETLQRKYGYLQKVFEGSWDPVGERWIRPSGKRFEWEQRVRGLFHLRTWSEPTIESLAEYLQGAILIEEHEGSPFNTVSFIHADSQFALEVLRTVYAEADEILRQQDRKETTERKAYIVEQLERTSILEMRAALVGLLTHEESTMMMLLGSLPYAARVIEPAYVSEIPTAPPILVTFGTPFLGSLAIGIVLVSLVALFRME